MKLNVLKPGSKTRVNVGFCCSSPWSYSMWSEGSESVHLKKAPEHSTDRAADCPPENNSQIGGQN